MNSCEWTLKAYLSTCGYAHSIQTCELNEFGNSERIKRLTSRLPQGALRSDQGNMGSAEAAQCPESNIQSNFTYHRPCEPFTVSQETPLEVKAGHELPPTRRYVITCSERHALHLIHVASSYGDHNSPTYVK